MRWIILTTILLLFFSPLVFPDVSNGETYNLPPKIPTLRYIVDNLTGVYLTTDVSTSIIDPSICKITGFAVYPISSNCEAVAALHDTTTAITNSTLFGELEAVEENFAGMFFPNPVKLYYGLRIIQGGQTRVIVYYTRY